MDSSKAQLVGAIWAIVGIGYFLVMYLTDFSTDVVLIGALMVAVIAVTSPWWSRVITSRQS